MSSDSGAVSKDEGAIVADDPFNWSYLPSATRYREAVLPSAADRCGQLRAGRESDTTVGRHNNSLTLLRSANGTDLPFLHVPRFECSKSG